MALTDKLTSIADAIREKGGTTEKLTLDAMPTAIAALPTGGGEDPIPNPIIIKSNGGYTFAENCFDWILKNYIDRIDFTAANSYGTTYMFQNTVIEPPITVNFPVKTTVNTVSASGMFKNSNILIGEDFINSFSNKISGSAGDMFSDYKGETIPPLNFNKENKLTCSSFIYNCPNLKEVGTITGLKIGDSCSNMFSSNPLVREYKFADCDFSAMNTSTYGYCQGAFSNNYSLRRIDPDFLKRFYGLFANNQLNGTFSYCYALDEVVGLSPITQEQTYNRCSNLFIYCYHLKRIVFDTQEDGTPYTVKWKKQTIDLSQYTGWAGYGTAHKDITTKYNSGITEDKEVVSAADYQRLKDDPDWWSRNFNFSRFGHNAAVELINSLPDASAYLATQTGTGNNNIVKFYSNAGNAIDGGGVNALTEEEIAVAAAKGWSIAYGT